MPGMASTCVGQRVPGGTEAEAQLTGEQSRGLAEAARRPFCARLQEWQRALPVPPAGVQRHRAPTAHAVELLLGDWPPQQAVHEMEETP